MWIADRRHYEPISVLQSRYNLIYREAEMEVLPAVRELGLGLMIYSPLAIGLLSGRFRSDRQPPADSPWGQGYRGFERLMTPQTDRLADELAIIADSRETTSAVVALAWILSHREITSVIVGPDRPEQVEENVSASSCDLNPEEVRRLDECSEPDWARRP
jgi:aryl-alcohol dehydrogenase (NADP+)